MNVRIPYLLQNDLETISCYAAKEIDGFILGCNKKFSTVNRLIKILQKSIIVSDKYQLNSSIATIIYGAIQDYRPDLFKPADTIYKLIDETKKFTENLEELISNPTKLQSHELEDLRSFCLSLSEKAHGYEEPYEDSNGQNYT